VGDEISNVLDIRSPWAIDLVSDLLLVLPRSPLHSSIAVKELEQHRSVAPSGFEQEEAAPR
jgi:hypothetical protein